MPRPKSLIRASSVFASAASSWIVPLRSTRLVVLPLDHEVLDPVEPCLRADLAERDLEVRKLDVGRARAGRASDSPVPASRTLLFTDSASILLTFVQSRPSICSRKPLRSHCLAFVAAASCFPDALVSLTSSGCELQRQEALLLRRSVEVWKARLGQQRVGELALALRLELVVRHHDRARLTGRTCPSTYPPPSRTTGRHSRSRWRRRTARTSPSRCAFAGRRRPRRAVAPRPLPGRNHRRPTGRDRTSHHPTSRNRLLGSVQTARHGGSVKHNAEGRVTKVHWTLIYAATDVVRPDCGVSPPGPPGVSMPSVKTQTFTSIRVDDR